MNLPSFKLYNPYANLFRAPFLGVITAFIDSFTVLFYQVQCLSLVHLFVDCKRVLSNVINVLNNSLTTITFNFNVEAVILFLSTYKQNVGSIAKNGNLDYTFITNPISTESLNDQVKRCLEESSTDYRYQRFTNPIFKYDYKAGNYLPKETTESFTFLFNTLSEVTGGVRKSA
jgi:hypothetical protein